MWGSAKVELKDNVIKDNKYCGIFVRSDGAQVGGGPHEMWGNGADLCGYAPAGLRKPLVPQTERTQLSIPQDYESLQEAVDAIAPGGTITVAAGSYQEGLTIWKPLRLVGEGKERTIIKTLPGRKLTVSIIAEAEGAVLEGLEVTGSQRDGLLIFSGAELRSIGISGNRWDGLDVEGSAKVTLTDSKVSENGKDGLFVRGSAEVTLTNSTVSENGDVGLYVRYSAKVTLTESTVSGNGYGLLVGDSAEVTLTDSQVSGNWDVGLYVGYSAKVTLTDSTVSGNGDEGLSVWDSAEVTLTDSTVSGNGYDGLFVVGPAKVTIKASTIEENGTDADCKDGVICNGIEAFGKSQIKIIDSTIRNNADWGLAAWLKKCGYNWDTFTGKVEFQGTNKIEGNNTSGNQNGMGNPGDHPWNRPEVPDGQVCLP